MTLVEMTFEADTAGRIDVRPETGTKPIDFSYLKRFTFSNRDLEREVLYLFAQSAPGYVRALRDARCAKDWHDSAHTLKGAARAVGAWRVARMAELAEKLRFDLEIDRRAFAADVASEALDEAIGYIVKVFPET
jgi:HPt (histidine-containing phosphotransfer) domain-containing protein